MDIFVFASTKWALTAFTSDETGGNLPSEFGPWSLVRRMYFASAVDPIAAAVKEEGFFLVSTGRKVTK
jgi:hypothetical protein